MARFQLRRPDAARIAALRDEYRHAPLSYEPVGAREVPPGWFDNRGGIELGRGEATFARAKDALRRWTMFDLGWVVAHPEPGAAFAPGDIGCMVTRVVLWSANLTRVLAVEDTPRKLAMTYGTLGHHVEMGEETFAVTWHADDRVTYDLWSYSRPAHPLVALFAPIARALQRRFVRDSCARMRDACRELGGA